MGVAHTRYIHEKLFMRRVAHKGYVLLRWLGRRKYEKLSSKLCAYLQSIEKKSAKFQNDP